MKRILCILAILLIIAYSFAYAEPLAKKVTLDRTYFLLRRDASFVLHASVEPADASQEIYWSSSKPGILSVEQDGTVTAIGNGSAVITAQAADGSGKKAKCTVNVLKAYVTDVILSCDQYTLDESVETSFTLDAVVLPHYAGVKDLRWKSSDESIATVNSKGRVTMKKGLGNTKVVTISAETIDASGVKGECEVTVNPVVYRALVARTDETAPGIYRALGLLDNTPYHVVNTPIDSMESLSQILSDRFSTTDDNDVSLIYLSGEAQGNGLLLPDGSLLHAEVLSELLSSIQGRKIVLVDARSDYPDDFCTQFSRPLSSDPVFIVASPTLTGEHLFALGAGWNTEKESRSGLAADRNRDKKVTWAEYCMYLTTQFEKEADRQGAIRSMSSSEPYDLVLFAR